MIWRPARRRPVPRIAGDGVDDQLWEYLCDVIVAVHGSDLTAFEAGLRRLSDYLARPDVHGQLGIMTTYLIKHRIFLMLGQRVATLTDLEELTSVYHDAYRKIIKETLPLYRVLVSAWDLGPKDIEVTGNTYILGCLGALGVLLDDPRPQLEELRRPMAAWYRRTMAKHRPGVRG